MNKKMFLIVGGILAGVVGAVLLREHLLHQGGKSVGEKLFQKRIRKKTPVKNATKSKSTGKKSSLAAKLLRYMKQGTAYTQVELQQISSIPYRSVRRYVESLVKEGKVRETGYGKGKRFSR